MRTTVQYPWLDPDIPLRGTLKKSYRSPTRLQLPHYIWNMSATPSPLTLSGYLLPGPEDNDMRNREREDILPLPIQIKLQPQLNNYYYNTY
jgi:hypothetical protein